MATSSTPATDQLQKLKQACDRVKTELRQKHKSFYQWLDDHGVSPAEVRQVSQQLLAAMSLAGSVALHAPTDAQVPAPVLAKEETSTSDSALLASLTQEEHDEVLAKLKSIVQMPPGHMDQETELYLEQQLSEILGFEVTAELDGHRLNHSIGIMGGEQHLMRFPGDTLDQHDAYQEAGMAPARGAFGWFTQNGELTAEAVQNEKYYFAVQTLYLPNWNQEYTTLKPWYKFRKMIVINPAEKVAVVGVVGDAGPAEWVQKQFGGSPEVIREGKIWSPVSRGRVLLLFVDDPENQIPLGPIDLEYQSQFLAELEGGGSS